MSTFERRTTAHVVSTLGRSGPTAQLLNLVRYLSASSFRPVVITLSPEPADSLKSEFDALGIQVESLKLSRIAGMLVGKRRLQRQLASIDPDVIHTQGFRADSLVASIAPIVPHVASIRNYAYEDYPNKFGKLRGSWMARKHLSALSRVGNRVFCSNSLAKRVGDLHDLDGLVIQNGVDGALFHPGDLDERTDVRRELGVMPDETLVVVIGSLVPLKHPVEALDAFLESSASEKGKIAYIGGGPLVVELKDRSGDDPRVMALGQRTDVPSLLRGADLLLSTSSSEGMPNAVLEALLSGVPVCLSDIPSHLEIAAEVPEDVEIFPLGSAQKAASAIDAIVARSEPEKDREKLASDAQVFDADNNGASYHKLFTKLTDNVKQTA
ncbi:MAG: glycosyltransferase [Chloroflexi bacterium]|jgi:glycosyltransferase involved in cell wall biosynthesis|nr:glycosyltransferase [Chloroflexota bacterium]